MLLLENGEESKSNSVPLNGTLSWNQATQRQLVHLRQAHEIGPRKITKYVVEDWVVDKWINLPIMRFPLWGLRGLKSTNPMCRFSPKVDWRRRRFLVCKIIHLNGLVGLTGLESLVNIPVCLGRVQFVCGAIQRQIGIDVWKLDRACPFQLLWESNAER